MPFCSIVKNGIKGVADSGKNDSAKTFLVAAASPKCSVSTRRTSRAEVDEHAQVAFLQLVSLTRAPHFAVVANMRTRRSIIVSWHA